MGVFWAEEGGCVMKKICGIYTRKSTDERLDMEFNTLDAQREACEAYILSQKSEGWVASPEQYDDGGYSGGNLDRPDLNKLIEDIKAGKINVIVVYKIDRLTRSLTDFSKLVEVFDEYGVTFVSITQSFNTTTSMGRLTLNVLLSFAQFEREVSGERIRDKIAASKARGMWQGGRPPFGFDIGDRRLVTNAEDAPKTKEIFELYLELGCVQKLKQELELRGIKSRERVSRKHLTYGGKYFSRGALYSMLQNPTYIGKISHKGKIHEGLHDAIISIELWDQVQEKLKYQAAHPRGLKKKRHKNMLANVMFDEQGNAYAPVFTNKQNKKYRYYLNAAMNEHKDHPNKLRARLPAHEIEAVIEKAVRSEIKNLMGDTSSEVLMHVLKKHRDIPTYDLVRTCAERIIVKHDALIVKLVSGDFAKLVEQHLNVSVTGCADDFEVAVPYQTKRGRDGAIVIESDRRDIFDMPSADLKHFIQGIVWRDEHFAGAHISDIARREDCSSRRIRNAIMNSFDTRLAA